MVITMEDKCINVIMLDFVLTCFSLYQEATKMVQLSQNENFEHVVTQDSSLSEKDAK